MKVRDLQEPLNVSVHEVVQAQDSLRLQLIHEYYERHPVLLPLVLAIIIGSPSLGFVFAGWVGFFIGLLINIVSFLLVSALLQRFVKFRKIIEPSPSVLAASLYRLPRLSYR